MVFLIESVFYTHTHTHTQTKQKESSLVIFFCPLIFPFLGYMELLRKRLRKMDEIEDWKIRMG
jgi:hypothetical protein